MAERKVGSVVCWKPLSSLLSIFQLMPEEGSAFPDYKAGQYIALRRDDCKLTKKIGTGGDGSPIFGPDLDDNGVQKRGPVTHSYSISSAPFETAQHQYLEFYVILEKDEEGHPGRLTESMFRMDVESDNKITYFNRITGDFTLDKRAPGFKSVLLVGTGTGLAPFASMIKQLHHEAVEGNGSAGVSYTVLHTNRVYEELAYHQQLLEIEASRAFDFLYIPSVSRPDDRDHADKRLGKGRANNLLRHIFGMPLKEQDAVDAARAKGLDTAPYEAALERTVRPVMPEHIAPEQLRLRFDPPSTVILTCGNPSSMADIQLVAENNNIRFEKEDW